MIPNPTRTLTPLWDYKLFRLSNGNMCIVGLLALINLYGLMGLLLIVPELGPLFNCRFGHIIRPLLSIGLE